MCACAAHQRVAGPEGRRGGGSRELVKLRKVGGGAPPPPRPLMSLTCAYAAHITGPASYHRSAATVTVWRLQPPPPPPTPRDSDARRCGWPPSCSVPGSCACAGSSEPFTTQTPRPNNILHSPWTIPFIASCPWLVTCNTHLQLFLFQFCLCLCMCVCSGKG